MQIKNELFFSPYMKSVANKIDIFINRFILLYEWII